MGKILAFKTDDEYHRQIEREAKKLPDRTISDLLRETMHKAFPPKKGIKKPSPDPDGNSD